MKDTEEWFLTKDMITQMVRCAEQAEAAKNGMRDRVQIAIKVHRSLIRLLVKETDIEFDFERFAGYISYRRIDWKPLNTASFERLMIEFYKEEKEIFVSSIQKNIPINEQRVLDIERRGKAIISQHLDLVVGCTDTQLEIPQPSPETPKPKKRTTKERDLEILAKYLELIKVKPHTIVMNYLEAWVIKLGIKSSQKNQIRRILRENGINY
jgi:hypothetical protein